MPDIKDYTHAELVSWLEHLHISPYRAAQILKWIYIRNADTFDEMSDISKDFRRQLSEHFVISRLEKIRMDVSQDGTKKYLFRLIDGNYIESVLIPEKDHFTLCISTQAGCAQGCKFCLTATGGFKRNLTQGEILAQVRDIQKEINPSAQSVQGGLTNIVLMGMGEPLANYDNVIGAIHILTNREFGLNFSTRRVTLSTAGLVPRIADLGRDTEISLAVSLNAADNATRDRLMPINRKYPIETLLDACRKFPLRHRRRITFEYILIDGVNDSEADAARLAKLLRPLQAKINLIPFNPHEGSEFKRSPDDTVFRFQEILHNQRYTVMIRQSKGQDISAACGQLKARTFTA